MQVDPPWTTVPVGRVLFVYRDDRYVGEVGRGLITRKGGRWWASTGWETRRSWYPTREAALDSLRSDRGTR
jgi:hypothetical protein